MISPAPTAKPTAGRFDGVVVTPRKPVMSARAIAGELIDSRRQGQNGPGHAGGHAPDRTASSVPLRRRALDSIVDSPGGHDGVRTDVIISSRGLSADRRAGTPAAHRARVRRSRDAAARDGVGRGAALSDGAAAQARRARLARAFSSPRSTAAPRMSAVDYCICIEELARVCPAIALSVAAHNGLCSSHIALFGNEAQKRRTCRGSFAARSSAPGD